jgi:hypothetical protein
VHILLNREEVDMLRREIDALQSRMHQIREQLLASSGEESAVVYRATEVELALQRLEWVMERECPE